METHGKDAYGLEWEAFVSIAGHVRIEVEANESGFSLTASEARRLAECLTWLADKAVQEPAHKGAK